VTTPSSLPIQQLAHEEVVGRRLALISISISVVLAAAKLIVGVKAGSTAVISDGLEASGDVLSSAIVYAGLWLASKPPDAEHPYGHGRYETLAGLAVGGLLLLTGAAILWHGILPQGQASPIAAFAAYPLVGAVIAKLVLSLSKFRVGKKIDSSSLQADAWHDITDLLSTVVALIAVLLAVGNPNHFGSADRYGGIAIGIIILFLSVRVVRHTIGSLLDTMPETNKLREIREVAMSVPGTLGIEKCLARRTGLRYHVDLHLEVDPEMTVRQSHNIATQVKNSIKQTLPWVADVLVHVEPSTLAVESTVN
jgi:cation diffusion facilitator family transporter